MHDTSFHRDRIGPYTLLRRIGREAAGEVWLVERDSQIARTRLALKLLYADTADIIDIRREAQLWIEAANHLDVLPLFEADIYDGRFVLVSEYAREGSLDDWLAGHGGKAPSVDAAVRLGVGVLAGLEHLPGISQMSVNLVVRDLARLS